MSWFKRLWRRPPARAPRPVRTFRPALEGFDERVMPAHFGHFHSLTGASFASAGTASSVTRLTATLTGATGTSGHARYHADATASTNGFAVRVSGLAASATFDVKIDGTTVGQVTTDANGAGRVSLTTLTAAVAAGSVVTVVAASGATVLTGTFAAAPSHGGCHG